MISFLTWFSYIRPNIPFSVDNIQYPDFKLTISSALWQCPISSFEGYRAPLPEIKEIAMCLCFLIKLCKVINISMRPILISLLNSIHVFQLCASHMSSDCFPLFLVMLTLPSPAYQQWLLFWREKQVLSSSDNRPRQMGRLLRRSKFILVARALEFYS